MLVREIMTKDVSCCTPDTRLQDVTRMMRDCDCGAIPVVQDQESKRLIGIVTDRDLAVRAIANDATADEPVGDYMTTDVVTCTPESDLDTCESLMEGRQVRRIPVVDENRCCVGIVAQADLARNCPPEEVAEVVAEISK